MVTFNLRTDDGTLISTENRLMILNIIGLMAGFDWRGTGFERRGVTRLVFTFRNDGHFSWINVVDNMGSCRLRLACWTRRKFMQELQTAGPIDEIRFNFARLPRLDIYNETHSEQFQTVLRLLNELFDTTTWQLKVIHRVFP